MWDTVTGGESQSGQGSTVSIDAVDAIATLLHFHLQDIVAAGVSRKQGRQRPIRPRAGKGAISGSGGGDGRVVAAHIPTTTHNL